MATPGSASENAAITADYTLTLSEYELARYRRMAAAAQTAEHAAWADAGVLPGARVADVGCGPGLVLCELARSVGLGGTVVGVERDPDARATAHAVIAADGIANATIVAGDAAATPLEPATFDVVMMRHVLLHNSDRAQAIVEHLGALLRPGGHLYLVESDITAIRRSLDDPDLADCQTRWVLLMEQLGNDPAIGPRLCQLVDAAGLELVDHDARYDIYPRTGEVRPPEWAARQAMVDAGLATEDDLARWDQAYDRDAAAGGRRLTFVPNFRVLGAAPV